MKFLKSCLLALSLAFLPGAAKAEQVDWGALGNFIVQNNGVPLTNVAPGSTLLLVHFNDGQNFAGQSYSSLLAANAFQVYDTSFIGEGSLPAGQFFASTPSTLPGVVNDRLYMWFFNSADPATATQSALITNANWLRPASGATTVSYDASDLGTFVPAGALGSIDTSPAPGVLVGNIRLAPVPEPSTYALALVGLGVAAGIARRRRQAVG